MTGPFQRATKENMKISDRQRRLLEALEIDSVAHKHPWGSPEHTDWMHVTGNLVRGGLITLTAEGGADITARGKDALTRSRNRAKRRAYTVANPPVRHSKEPLPPAIAALLAKITGAAK